MFSDLNQKDFPNYFWSVICGSLASRFQLIISLIYHFYPLFLKLKVFQISCSLVTGSEVLNTSARVGLILESSACNCLMWRQQELPNQHGSSWSLMCWLMIVPIEFSKPVAIQWPSNLMFWSWELRCKIVVDQSTLAWWFWPFKPFQLFSLSIEPVCSLYL